MANAIGPTDKIGDLVTQDPHRAHLFEQLNLDYCCGGLRTLADACAERGLDAATVIALLRGQQDSPDPAGAHDVARASITELCDHVVAAHHQRLRRDLPRIDELLTKVVRAHGEGHHELYDLQRRFAGMRSSLEDHLVVEEETLFPACRELDESDHGPAELDEALLDLHEGEHNEVGDALRALRELSGEYRLEDALCGTHRVLLHSLQDLELDLHQHVHEENNVLFPRVRGRLAARGSGLTPR